MRFEGGNNDNQYNRYRETKIKVSNELLFAFKVYRTILSLINAKMY